MDVRTHTLKNGLRVVLAPSPAADSVTVMVMSGTGARYERKEENGMAHFLEHMVFKGTKKRKSPQIIAEAIDAVGGTFNAFTAKDHTAYYAKVGKAHFDVAFDIVSDIFLNPTFPKKELEKERGTIIEEINMYEDMPIYGIHFESDVTIFGDGHAMGHTVLGPKENIRSFTRKQFTDYFTRHYVAENSAVCIAGNFSERAVLAKVRKAFGAMRTGDVTMPEPYTHAQNAPRVRIKHKKTDQTHFALALPSVPLNHKDEIVAEVLAAVLGGGTSSRLFSEIRERRGLAYYVRAENDPYTDTGVLLMRAGVTNEKLPLAVELTVKELRKLVRTRVSAKELKKAKEYLKGGTALSLETTDARTNFIGYSVLVRNKTPDITAFNKKIDAVTPAQLQRVAKELLTTNHLNLTVIGPHKNEQELAKLLRI